MISKQCFKTGLFLRKLLRIIFHLNSHHQIGSHLLSMAAIEIRTKIKIIIRFREVSLHSNRISNHSNSFKSQFYHILPLMLIQMLGLLSVPLPATLLHFITSTSIIINTSITLSHFSSTLQLVLEEMRRQFLIVSGLDFQVVVEMEAP